MLHYVAKMPCNTFQVFLTLPQSGHANYYFNNEAMDDRVGTRQKYRWQLVFMVAEDGLVFHLFQSYPQTVSAYPVQLHEVLFFYFITGTRQFIYDRMTLTKIGEEKHPFSNAEYSFDCTQE